MDTNNVDTLFYLLIAFFGLYIFLQFYIVLRMKVIIHKLLEILLQFENLMRRIGYTRKEKNPQTIHACQNCKYRMTFFHNDVDNPGYLYYKCQISRKKVASNYLCKNFVFDSQIYGV